MGPRTGFRALSEDGERDPPAGGAAEARGICLTVAYDGTDFAGYQLQPGERTVQGELERAIETMSGGPVRVRAAGRTDAGVHALGQRVAFDVEPSRADIPLEGWERGLNSNLPEDIVVRGAMWCAPRYEPRYDAIDKTYRYLVHVGGAPNPLMRKRAWHLGKPRTDARSPFDAARAGEAARAFEGTHDFRAYCAADGDSKTTVRTIHSLRVREGFAEDPELIALEVRGNAFLKNMVRILAGTIVDVALGRRGAETIARTLDPRASREDAGKTAPAHGLTLVEVRLGRKSAAGA